MVYFAPTIKLKKQYDFPFSFFLNIKQYVSCGSDNRIGEIHVTFGPKQTEPATENVKYHPDQRAEDRGIATALGRYWLVFTKRGRIRGNVVKGDEGDSMIYLQTTSKKHEGSILEPTPYQIGKRKSPEHAVKRG